MNHDHDGHGEVISSADETIPWIGEGFPFVTTLICLHTCARSKSYCPYCNRVKSILSSLKARFQVSFDLG